MAVEHAVVVALSGCTATGKTTLALALQQRFPQRVEIVHADRHHLPAAHCQKLDLHGLPWPSGSVPQAFLERGYADLNIPSSIRWTTLHDAVTAAVDGDTSTPAAGDAPRLVIVEGHLLFSAHAGAARLRKLCSHHVVLDADGDDALVMETLWRRKYQRKHLGKPSYASRGVTAEEYAVWWSSYCWPRWVEHGQVAVPSTALRLDCLQPRTALADALVDATGWG